jgi:hypothetical protein
MSTRERLTLSVASMTTRLLTRRARRARSGGTRWSTSDTLLLITLIAYLMSECIRLLSSTK